MDEGSPELSVGFAIETAGAFASLEKFYDQFDAGTVQVLKMVAQVEKATGGMVKVEPAIGSIKSIANAATRSEQDIRKAKAQTEKAGEALVRQLEREAATYGMTRSEIRSMKAEQLALAATQQGNGDLAARLTAAEAALYDKQFAAMRKAKAEADALAEAKALAASEAVAAAEREAEAVRKAAFAYQMFEARAREGMEALRVQEANAAAAERLRMATDPLYASTKRLNDQIAESTRLFRAGATTELEYARQQDVLRQRIVALTEAEEAHTIAVRRGTSSLTMLSFQVNDVATMALTGASAFQILATQGGQFVQVAQMAEGGAKGLAAEVGLLAVRFAPLIGVAALATAGLGLFVRYVNEGVTNNQLTRDLGDITGGADATKQELYKLRDATVTWGDVSKALFSEIGKDIADEFVVDIQGMSKDVKAALDDMTSYGKAALAGLYAGLAGTRAYLAEVGTWKGLKNLVMGDPTILDRTYGATFRKAEDYLTELGKRVKAAAIENARNRLAGTVGYNDPKADRHAEQLARDAAATEAQIRNLYKLADAYGVSGAAALIAAAKAKAETDAIKHGGDVTAETDRQVRLAVAQRVSDAAKSAAAMRDQARIQAEVNAAVAGGNVSSKQAAELVQERIADLPLLAAIDAAYQRGLTGEAKAATKALNDQRDAQAAVRAAAIGQFYTSADAAANQRLATLREELRLVGATDAERVRALAAMKATQDLQNAGMKLGTTYANNYKDKQVEIADLQQQISDAQRDYDDALNFTADKWDLIARNIQAAGQGMADAFGSAGRSLGDLASAYAEYRAQQEREAVAHRRNLDLATTQAAVDRENAKHALATSTTQVALYGDMAAAAKGFFGKNAAGYKAMADAEKAFRAIQFALSVKAMAQDAIETGSALAKSAERTAAGAVEAVVNAIKSLPFPLNLAAGAATIAALAAIGVSVAGSFGGGHNTLPKANDGTGTVLGDATAKSASIKNAIDALKDVDDLTNTYAREMSASLKSIDSQIGSLATVLVRAGDINASAGVDTSFKPNLIGSVLGAIPLVGGILGSLFGSKKTVIGSGIYGAPQSLGSILAGGFDAEAYSDIKKKHKFFGITTGTSYNTKYGALDPTLSGQFTLILKQFHDAIAAAAGPLGVATSAIEQRLNGFVVNIGKIDLKDLTGEQIQDKLEAVFGAAADTMANAAFPGISKFQKVGEGAFETLVRVASTVEQVTNALAELGDTTKSLGIDAKMGLAAQFDSISDMSSAVDAYFQAFYSKEEQAAAQTAEMTRVFDSLGLTMPTTLDAFRQLVEAQDLTTAAGQSTYATLIKLAPAFADLQQSLNGAKSAADIASEREDLQKQLLQLQGKTAELRQMQLDKLDPSNRALQQQIFAIQDAQDAAKAAQDLADAWKSVGDSILDEVKRIRGLTDTATGGSFAALMGQFNAATAAARGGDQDAAKSLPQLSQALLNAANLQATSRQELDRVQAQVAASLEKTYAAIMAAQGSPVAGAANGTLTPAIVSVDALSAAAAGQPAPAPANDDLVSEIKALREEVAHLRTDNNAGHAATAGNTGAIKRTLDDVTAASGGDAISTVAA